MLLAFFNCFLGADLSLRSSEFVQSCHSVHLNSDNGGAFFLAVLTIESLGWLIFLPFSSKLIILGTSFANALCGSAPPLSNYPSPITNTFYRIRCEFLSCEFNCFVTFCCIWIPDFINSIIAERAALFTHIGPSAPGIGLISAILKVVTDRIFCIWSHNGVELAIVLHLTIDKLAIPCKLERLVKP